MNFVEIKNISKSFGDHIIFDDVSLSIDQGQCVGFIGENGVGKSVLSVSYTHLTLPTSDLV